MREDQITCDALRLALVAVRLRVAWHAGAISAETAMEELDYAFGQLRPSYPERILVDSPSD